MAQHAQMRAALGGAQEQRLRTRCSMMQAILRTVCTGRALVINQRLEVSRIFELRTAIEAARVGRNHLIAIEDAHGIETGSDEERTVHAIVRDRVIVQIKAHVWRFMRAHLDALFTWKRVLRQGEKIAPLLLEYLAHATAAVFGTGSVRSATLTPGERLRVQIVEIAKLTRREEGVPYKPNCALD